ncbi:MAG TPA: hypothetical protein VNA12_08400, partial [Mycobacteriales bacterium]|nr:hypothetical protein [Mycobacteriales bacterium]
RRNSGCASVWATESGARVAFDLGNVSAGTPESEHLTAAEVTKAIAVLRRERPRWGIARLPEAGLISAVPEYGPGACQTPHHPDHAAVLRSLYDVAHGAGPQYGPVACPTDPYYVNNPGPPAPLPQEIVDMNYVDPLTERRVGPFVVQYGWVWSTYAFGGDPAGFFWQRFPSGRLPRG